MNPEPPRLPPRDSDVQEVWDHTVEAEPDLDRPTRAHRVATVLGISSELVRVQVGPERWLVRDSDGAPLPVDETLIMMVWLRVRRDSPDLGRYAAADLVAGVLNINKLMVLSVIGFAAFAEARDDSRQEWEPK